MQKLLELRELTADEKRRLDEDLARAPYEMRRACELLKPSLARMILDGWLAQEQAEQKRASTSGLSLDAYRAARKREWEARKAKEERDAQAAWEARQAATNSKGGGWS